MRTTLLDEPATEIRFRATRQPKSSRLGTYVGIELKAYPLNVNSIMSIESARGLLLELQAAIAAAEVLEAGPEVTE